MSYPILSCNEIVEYLLTGHLVRRGKYIKLAKMPSSVNLSDLLRLEFD